MPLVVIVAFAIGAATGGNSPSASSTGAAGPVTVSAPPDVAAQSAACTKVLAALPVQLNKLAPRIVHPNPPTPFVVAWGNPAVVLRCGVARPKSLVAGSSTQYFDGGEIAGPYFDITGNGKTANVYTTVDRAAYISITVPSKYQGSSVVTPLATAIGKALPAVCSTDSTNAPTAELCTRRK